MTGHEKTHFTVVLACMADSMKLKPTVIFKWKTLPKGAKFFGRCSRPLACEGLDGRGRNEGVAAEGLEQEARCVTEETVSRRVGYVPHARHWQHEKGGQPLNVNLCIIAGGLASMLQPLDVSLNKPFKDSVWRLWNEWMSSGDVKLTKGGNMMKPDFTLCCQWVNRPGTSPCWDG